MIVQAAVAQGAAEFFAQSVFCQIGDVPHHAGDAQTSARLGAVLRVVSFMEIGVGQDGLARHIVERDVLRAQTRRGRNHQRMAHPFGEIHRPLQRLHTAQAAAHHGRPLRNAQAVGQQCLAFHPVRHGHHREIRAVLPPCFGIGAQRPGAACAAAQIVQRHHEEFVRVDGFARANHVVPPARIFVVRAVPSGGVVRAGKRVANQNRVGFVGIQFAVGFHYQLKTRQGLPVLQREGGVEREGFRGNDGVAGNGHGGMADGLGVEKAACTLTFSRRRFGYCAVSVSSSVRRRNSTSSLPMCCTI